MASFSGLVYIFFFLEDDGNKPFSFTSTKQCQTFKIYCSYESIIKLIKLYSLKAIRLIKCP